MTSTKSVKQRIKSVKNTSQITKAMEVVSATKMRRSQEFALIARPYAVASLELLNNLLVRTPILPDLLQARSITRTCYLVVTSDKGLAGAFNGNILKKFESLMQANVQTHATFTTIAVGKKIRDYVERKNIPMEKKFWGFGDYTTLEETKDIADMIIKGYRSELWDQVIAVYTNFRSTLRQETVAKKILPATREGITDTIIGILPESGRFSQTQMRDTQNENRFSFEYKFEPSSKEILDSLAIQLIRIHVHHIILESNASEHSARMVAMKSASDNARELMEKLTIAYNKARQSGITQELTEITAGREALEGQ
ncbi:MAG: ATP synthase F1 subunit gamma [Candidatus Sungbacteria bacterium]|nr:ATP synthase F1 subunit gamma [bacterium]MDZ4260544.1 ATP synthase F1 subunit gamma [Candidatus Sungbacteria bacterium]